MNRECGQERDDEVKRKLRRRNMGKREEVKEAGKGQVKCKETERRRWTDTLQKCPGRNEIL